MRQCHFFRADVDYGQRVAQALNIQIDPSLLQQNQQNNPQPVAVISLSYLFSPLGG